MTRNRTFGFVSVIAVLVLALAVTLAYNTGESRARRAMAGGGEPTPTAIMQPTDEPTTEPMEVIVQGVIPTPEPTATPESIKAPLGSGMDKGVVVTGAPSCPAMTDGSTNCRCMEDWLDSQLLQVYGISDSGLLGTASYPLRYPETWLHDLCYAKSGGGTGAKYIEIWGPAALQMGETTGPLRMVYVPAGTLFEGWTQGGWRYTCDQAMEAQWHVEDPNSKNWEDLAKRRKLGLICGYENNMSGGTVRIPTYMWNGSIEVEDPALNCKLPLNITAPPPDTGKVEPPVVSKEDWELYPQIFKLELGGVYYCGAKASNVTYPTAYRHIEEYPKTAADKNYLHATGKWGMSTTDGFCSDDPVVKHGAPESTTWTTVLLETDGFHNVTFPIQ